MHPLLSSLERPNGSLGWREPRGGRFDSATFPITGNCNRLRLLALLGHGSAAELGFGWCRFCIRCFAGCAGCAGDMLGCGGEVEWWSL